MESAEAYKSPQEPKGAYRSPQERAAGLWEQFGGQRQRGSGAVAAVGCGRGGLGCGVVGPLARGRWCGGGSSAGGPIGPIDPSSLPPSWVG